MYLAEVQVTLNSDPGTINRTGQVQVTAKGECILRKYNKVNEKEKGFWNQCLLNEYCFWVITQ